MENCNQNIFQCIGKGGQGFVYKCNKGFAWKKAINKNIHEELNVLSILIKLKHKHICQIVYYEQINTKELLIGMELIPGQDLLDTTLNSASLPSYICLEYIQQILSGLHFLHSLHIAHRDLKLENMMIKNRNIKIIDFGLSKSYLNKEYSSKTLSGSFNYICPEIARNEKYNPFYADIWAAGICLFAMAMKVFPFHIAADSFNGHKISQFTTLRKTQKSANETPNTYDILNDLLKLKNHCHESIPLSDQYKELLHNLLQIKENERCTIQNLLQKIDKWNSVKVKRPAYDITCERKRSKK